MQLLTWNIQKKETALRAVCRYLARRRTCVACLQELPEDFSTLTVAAASSGRLNLLGSYKQRIAFVATKNIRTHEEPFVFIPGGLRCTAERMFGIELVGPGWGPLTIVGVHFPDRRNLPGGQDRGNVITLLSRDLRAHWHESNVPLVVMGDFNADPYHPEIAAPAYLWAVRDREELTYSRQSAPRKLEQGFRIAHSGSLYPTADDIRDLSYLQEMKPLYNPMWRWLPERRSLPRGTHHYRDDLCGISWHCYDQILLSKELVSSCRSLKILDTLDTDRLISHIQRPLGRQSVHHRFAPDASDHLPVEMILDLKGAAK